MNLSLPKSSIEFFKTLIPSHYGRLLSEEITYVKERMKFQSVIGGWWFSNGRFQRRLSRDENTAYYSIIRQ